MSHDQSLKRETNAGSMLMEITSIHLTTQLDRRKPTSTASADHVVRWSSRFAQPRRCRYYLGQRAATSASDHCSATMPKPGAETVSTLQQVLDYLTANKIQMVLALDLRDAATAIAVFQVLSNTINSLNRPYTMDAPFKVPAVAFSPGGNLNVGLLTGTFGENANVQPIFNTGDITSTYCLESQSGVNVERDQDCPMTIMALAAVTISFETPSIRPC